MDRGEKISDINHMLRLLDKILDEIYLSAGYWTCHGCTYTMVVITAKLEKLKVELLKELGE